MSVPAGNSVREAAPGRTFDALGETIESEHDSALSTRAAALTLLMHFFRAMCIRQASLAATEPVAVPVRRRRPMPAIPTKPVATNVNVAGSGVAVMGARGVMTHDVASMQGSDGFPSERPTTSRSASVIALGSNAREVKKLKVMS